MQLGKHNAGLSLLEVMVATALLGAISGAIILATDSTSKSMRTGSVLAEMDMVGSRVLDRIGEELAVAQRIDVLPASPAAEAPFHTSQLDFQATTYIGAVVGLDDAARIGFEYQPGEADDGVDNNTNGLTDEGVVVFTEDVGLVNARRNVLCRWVREALEGEVLGNGVDDNGNGLRDEGGLCFDFDGDRVTIRLTLERADPQGLLLTRTFERTIALRR